MEYTAKIDWQINSSVKQELVKRWVEISKLRISTTKGVIEIKGNLDFTGQAAGDTEMVSLMSRMKNIDRGLKGIPYVRDVHWKLDNWKRMGLRWIPGKEVEKKLLKETP